MEKELILLVDDDKAILESSEILLCDEFSVLTATSVSDAKDIMKASDVQLVVIDLNFEGHAEDGLNLINHLVKEYHQIPFVVLSGDQDTKRVVEAMKRPLTDFITKDGDHDELLRIAIKKGLNKKKELSQKKSNTSEFKTKSPQIFKMFKNLDKLLNSGSEASILINGESGTGKEYMAKYIASYLGKKLVAANMASIPRETAESELFGHMKGAFTGATSNKIGLLEQAHNGVFFLDEIGDCSLEIQAKLLRAVQEREIMPVGATVPRKITLRFIAATHKDLTQKVAEKEFRLDLLQRLNTFTFEIPALRDRPEDIEYYTTMFVNEFSNGVFFQIHPSAFHALKQHDWPGNVRELKNVIQRAMIFTDRRSINDEIIYRALNCTPQKIQKEITKEVSFDISKLKDDEIKTTIIKVLKATRGNKTAAAKCFGVDYSTLYRWIKKYNLDELIPSKRRGRPKLPLSITGVEV
ncbi:MAG: two-component system response regulator HydG [Bacteriovoracaceae bacterium]|jgi:DNA-binding NtrC family response regulator